MRLPRFAGAWLLVTVGLTGLPPAAAQQPPAQQPSAQPHSDGPHRPGPADGQKADGDDGESGGKAPDGFDWKKVPPVMPTPRYGDYWISPSGPGYYSLLDVIRNNYRESPPHLPYGNTGLMTHAYFDADFRYLDDPKNTQTDFFDFLKRRHPTDDWMLTAGGEERVRYMNQVNSNLSGRDNIFQLQRTRDFVDIWYQDRIRLYAEFIDARSFNQDRPPASNDVNQTDFLNLFADLKVLDLGGNPVYLRAGRQEMYYGSQRLVGRLDWANADRTFEGVKGFWRDEHWAVDAWWMMPVVFSPSHFDSVNDKVNFEGVFATYHHGKSRYWDLYYLNLDNRGSAPAGGTSAGGQAGGDSEGSGGNAGGGGAAPSPTATALSDTHSFNVSTLGSRYGGDIDGRLMFDFEGAVQFGQYAGAGDAAGMASGGVGYRFKDAWSTPQFWVLYDWASGDRNPGQGTRTTFNQLYNRGHHYFGYLDLVGRQNIRDLNPHFAFFPTNWWRVELQYHAFELDQAKDALYNSGGTATRQDPTGQAGRNVGQELDIRTDIAAGRHLVFMVGYSKLFAGEFLKRTGPPQSPELFYFQTIYRY